MKKIFLILALLAMPLASISAADVEGDGRTIPSSDSEEVSDDLNNSNIPAAVRAQLGDNGGNGAAVAGVEPDEIDNRAQRSNFAILLSSGGKDGENSKGQRAQEVLEILKNGLDNEGVAVKNISLNAERVTAKVKQRIKLFGFIPVSATATVEVDKEENVKVKFPWWTLFASGKEGDKIGGQVLGALLKTVNSNRDSLNVQTVN